VLTDELEIIHWLSWGHPKYVESLLFCSCPLFLPDL